MGRIITTIAHIFTLLGGVLAVPSLFAAMGRAAAGEPAIADLLFASAFVVVPYCIAGSLHRIVMLGRDEDPAARAD